MIRGDSGLFGPESVTWRVHGHPSTLIGGMRALLVQALHPLAMAGVAEHSDYRTDPWGRLRRTSEFVMVATYGTDRGGRGDRQPGPGRAHSCARHRPGDRACLPGRRPGAAGLRPQRARPFAAAGQAPLRRRHLEDGCRRLPGGDGAHGRARRYARRARADDDGRPAGLPPRSAGSGGLARGQAGRSRRAGSPAAPRRPSPVGRSGRRRGRIAARPTSGHVRLLLVHARRPRRPRRDDRPLRRRSAGSRRAGHLPAGRPKPDWRPERACATGF